MDDYYELFFSRQPSSELPRRRKNLQAKKMWMNPESHENLEKFKQEIESLGSSTNITATSNTIGSLLDTENKNQISRIQKDSWKSLAKNKRT
jgi:hypothetical protein